MLACSGGEFGGWTLFLKDGKFHYVHNYLKLDEFAVSSAEVVPAGQHTLSVHFTPTDSNDCNSNLAQSDDFIFVQGGSELQLRVNRCRRCL